MSPRNKIGMTGLVFLANLLVTLPAMAQSDVPDPFLLQLYHNHISVVDGDRCSMHPTCSRYAAMSFEKHGLLIGWIMTCDRLVRCGRDTVNLAPVITIRGRNKAYDPVEANDFWWFENENKAP